MTHSRTFAALSAIMLPPLALAQVPAGAPRKAASAQVVPTFEKQIRPLFVSQCAGCHNRTTVGNPALSGGLALDSYDSVLRGVQIPGKPARAVAMRGKPAGSSLATRLETQDALIRMPKGGDPLPKDKAALVRAWIAAGMPRGASAGPVTDPTLPPSAPPAPPLDVTIPTLLAPPAPLPAGAPKDARLAVAFKIGPLSPITALAWSPDGRLLAAGAYRTVQLWNMTDARLERTITGLAGAVQAVVWSPDGGRLAVAGGAPGSLGEAHVYDAKSGYRVAATLTGHTDTVNGIAFSPDGTRLATASHDKTVRTWESATGKRLLTIKAHSDVVYRVRYSPDGKFLYSCGQDRSVRQFNSADGAAIRTFDGHNQPVLALDVRGDGKALVTSGGEPRLRWWNTSDGGTPRYSDGCGQQVNDIAFSHDGKLLAAASADHSIRVWNGENGSPVKNFMETPDWSYAVAISPDDKLVAGGGADGLIRVWDIASGALRGSLIASQPKNLAPSTVPGYALVTPAGYFEVSDSLAHSASLKPLGLLKSDSAAMIAALKNPGMAVRAFRGDKVESPTLTKPSGSAPAPAPRK